MALSATHDNLDDIPETYRELYSEKNGKYELTGIAGIKTQFDIDRLQGSLHKAQADNKALKEKFSIWEDFEYEDVIAKLDRMPELEAAAADKLDDAGIEEIVTKRLNGTLNSKLAPVERQLKKMTEERDVYLLERDAFIAENQTRAIHDDVRAALVKAKVIPEAHDDALMLAERLFEVREDDKAVITKDNVGITPGVNAELWLQDVQTTRPHWWAPSQGGGARPGAQGAAGFAQNPWSPANWNMTKQGEIHKMHGPEKAAQMAQAAGTTVGGLKPKSKSEG